MSPEERDQFVKKVLAERDRLAPQFPDIDPGDMLLILESLLLPPEEDRRFFLRPLKDGGGYVP